MRAGRLSSRQPCQAQSVSHRTDKTSLESKRTRATGFSQTSIFYTCTHPSAAARTAPNGVKGRQVSALFFRSLNKGVLCTANKKKGGGGRKRAVSPQCEVRLKMATADFAIMRLTAQPHCKICIFFKRGAKNFRKPRKCTKKKKSDPKSPGLP